MKSRKEYFETRRTLMIISYICYGISIFLFLLCFFIRGGFATVVVVVSLLILAALTCSLYAHRQKEFLFCPKCGSKNIVKIGFMGIPVSITDTCPDCKNKINIDKSINKD